MENVVKTIINIDKQATDKLNEAVKNKDAVLEQAKSDAKKIADDANAAAMNKINRIEKEHSDALQSNMNEIQNKCAAEMKVLDDFYESKHIEIENEIFSRIVGD